MEIIDQIYIWNRDNYKKYLDRSSLSYFNYKKHYTFQSLHGITSLNRYCQNSLNYLDPEYIKKLEINAQSIKNFLENDNYKNMFFQRGSIEHRSLKNIDTCITSVGALGRRNSSGRLFYFGNGFIAVTEYIGNIENINYVAVLCVKQEYVYYFKLWLLNGGGELDYDIFYILVNKNLNIVNSPYGTTIRSVYRKSLLALSKHYGIPVIEVDNVNNEILRAIEIPKTKTISDYEDWLNSIKKEAILKIDVDGVNLY